MTGAKKDVEMLRLFQWGLIFIGAVYSTFIYANSDQVSKQEIDFIHYQAHLEPNFSEQLVQGEVLIRFKPDAENVTELQFSAQYKTILSIKLDGKDVKYNIEEDVLRVLLTKALEAGQEYQFAVNYSASPKRGMKFFDDHLFTVYHTKNWLIAHSAISDKASFELSLLHDPKLTAVSVGKLVSSNKVAGGKQLSVWQQLTPIPIYVFGFALGDFERVVLSKGESEIEVLYRKSDHSTLTRKMVEEAFKNALDMMLFFEQKSGIEFSTSPYRYLVVDGYMAQEVDGYSLVGEKFVHTLLKNKHENWFIAHELAHEWWGNSITSANFSHFWLNEGLVQFLVAAYKERLFGRQAYIDEIDVAIKRVARAVKENRTAPVAFKSEIAESEINRTMAYSKGALVFYMLRKELGDPLFWLALKQYSMKHKGGSVTSQDLKVAFEHATGKDLSPFFDTWVYGNNIPKIAH